MLKAFTEIVTSQGSRYRKLANGTTQRFKATEDRLYKPQDSIVFIPPYEALKQASPKGMDFEGLYGESELDFRQIILEYMNSGFTIYIVNEDGNELFTNKNIIESNRLFLKFGKKGEKIHFFIPVSKKPSIGYQIFDTSKFSDRDGITQISRHIGNAIVEIIT